MTLHLSVMLKDQKWPLGAHFMSKPVFERRRGEKGGERLGFARRMVLVGFASHFFLRRDQATYKRIFEEIR